MRKRLSVTTTKGETRAVAEDLIVKLKNLKFNMICQKEQLAIDRRKEFKKSKSKSFSNMESDDVETQDDNKHQNSQATLPDTLDITDIKTLIELLLAHNSYNMKYWIPKQVQSVLNNEEVSAYLLAYLNTADILESPRNFKGKQTAHLNSSKFFSNSKLDTIAEDYNFDVFTYDREILHQDTLRNAC